MPVKQKAKLMVIVVVLLAAVP